MPASLNAAAFDLDAYVARLNLGAGTDRPALRERAYRIEATKHDPLAFALVYLTKHLVSDATGGTLSLSDAHLAWRARAMTWANGKPTEQHADRHAEIAPRETGKSTWWFLIIPLWAAAHGYVKFAAAFADTATQAQTHLETFRTELNTNARLREDYPELCAPRLRGTRQSAVADNKKMIQQANGFIFAANGIDSGALGMKVGEKRPDLILLDDVEPGEDNYSLETMKGRLSSITDVVLPLNSFARVTITGTVTMPGSIMHQLVNKAKGIAPADPKAVAWIDDEHIQPHHYPAIVERADGTERSIWPARWSLAFLQSIRHTRSYAKNFANDPKGNDGDFWSMEDFKYDALLGVTRTLLEIDPAITTKKTSDYTGLAIVGYAPTKRHAVVKWARAVRLAPDKLRAYVLDLLDEYPEIRLIRIEVNQGGDVWKSILHDMPVRIKTVHNTVPKEVRAASALTHYQRGHVFHVKGQTDSLEEQQVTFPKAPNDDLVDAAGDGVCYFLNVPKKTKAGGVNYGYAGV